MQNGGYLMPIKTRKKFQLAALNDNFYFLLAEFQVFNGYFSL
jgi:hypothetical protein